MVPPLSDPPAFALRTSAGQARPTWPTRPTRPTSPGPAHRPAPTCCHRC